MTNQVSLGAVDYVVFGGTLLLSAIVGIYFAVKERIKKQSDPESYLLAGKSMGAVPVSLSLAVSFMAATLMLGYPLEIYYYGTMFIWSNVGIFAANCITTEIFIPVFHSLGISSSFEYIDLRFGHNIRRLATSIYLLQSLVYLGAAIYAPSLALSAVTGFNLWAAVVSVVLVCVFYTTLGGLKAVIWTDVFQAVIMISGSIAIIIRGSIILGGFGRIWELNEEGGRIDFLLFELDPRIRNTFWSCVVGFTIYYTGSVSLNQAQIQRYMCCPSVKTAKTATLLSALYQCVFCMGLAMVGLVSYAYFKDCDPLMNGEISAADQLVPYMVGKMFKDFPGLPGLYMASVFSGSLSTVSSAINAMSLTVVHDFLKPKFNWTDRTFTMVSKGVALCLGLISGVMAYFSSFLGRILQAVISVLGIVGGSFIGLFTLGFIFPCANAWGAGTGMISGLAFVIWIFVGSKIYPPSSQFTHILPVYTSYCPVSNETDVLSITSNMTTLVYDTSTVTTTMISEVETRPPIADLYAISYLYYSSVGFATTLIIGLAVSFMPGGNKQRKDVDPRLIYHLFDHWMFGWLPMCFKSCMRCGLKTVKENESTKQQIDNTEGDSVVTKELATVIENDHVALDNLSGVTEVENETSIHEIQETSAIEIQRSITNN